MRLALILALAPLPALAWEFSPTPLCTLSHVSESASLVMTHDPAAPLYSLSVTLSDGTWEDRPFVVDFVAGAPPQIGTTLHSLSEDSRTLTVTDRGFSNVISGLKTGSEVILSTGLTTIPLDLNGIRDPLAAFEACPQAPLATS